ncbi:hypothetical protein BHM03_00033968 [Ensete ventricosum]|nr:hypothetical protein BHM03_00033968 [Ensete ventricosum]
MISCYWELYFDEQHNDKKGWIQGVNVVVPQWRVFSRGSATQKQSIGQKGGGLGGVSRCCKGGSTDRKQRDADARQRIVAPWNRRGETSMESSIPCSHRGRALVVKGTEDVENAEANSKYQDKARGQRPRNFIRPMSMGFSLR